ncbi:hypothetical protein MetMK1DRAFT_00028140 [Metallosphaera yellowstonensis MK1]|jgi:hypothetical protein|uniref:Uncharacterized protein n=1 Tax=Metallosphaera yellowstonensis MK1 TaxID=671065 RepID=H2C8A6_9CREN|nr:hypothetical protein MetMK1DRAFT_00028140 [Metallosphaera yellowstonensis MK1]
MSLLPIAVFIVYGILSPLYYRLLRGKLSNEVAFLVTWVTAPFLASYPFFYSDLVVLLVLLMINLVGYLLIIKHRYKYIYNGIIFLLVPVVTILIFKLLTFI